MTFYDKFIERIGILSKEFTDINRVTGEILYLKVDLSKRSNLIESLNKGISNHKKIIDDLTYNKVCHETVKKLDENFSKIKSFKESLHYHHKMNYLKYIDLLALTFINELLSIKNPKERTIGKVYDILKGKHHILNSEELKVFNLIKDPVLAARKYIVKLNFKIKPDLFEPYPFPKKQEPYKVKCPDNCECPICKRFNNNRITLIWLD